MREVDAMDGLVGKLVGELTWEGRSVQRNRRLIVRHIDKAGIQFHVLNRSKGAAVHVCRFRYPPTYVVSYLIAGTSRSSLANAVPQSYARHASDISKSHDQGWKRSRSRAGSSGRSCCDFEVCDNHPWRSDRYPNGSWGVYPLRQGRYLYWHFPGWSDQYWSEEYAIWANWVSFSRATARRSAS